MKEELEKKARELGDGSQSVQVFKSKKDFQAFHLKPRGAGA
jgi:hypothetical protein